MASPPAPGSPLSPEGPGCWCFGQLPQRTAMPMTARAAASSSPAAAAKR